MRQTFKQWQALRHGQTYNHDPRHFRFERTIRGYHPEPDALPVDKIIAAICCIAIVGLIVVSRL